MKKAWALVSEPGIPEIGIGAAVNRNLHLQAVIGRRQHKRLAFQLDRFTVLFDRRRFPKDCVITAEVAANRPCFYSRTPNNPVSERVTTFSFSLYVVVALPLNAPCGPSPSITLS